jgi:hypothetical protein
MKLKYIIAIIIIALIGIISSGDFSSPVTVKNDKLDAKTEAVISKKTVATQPEIQTEASEAQKTPVEIAVSTPKKKATQSLEESARETEKEFLEMKLLTTFSSVKEIRYQEIYNIYQKTSFYLSEVAANRLETNKENLLKSFKGLITYFNEDSSMEQMDSALFIIQQEEPGLFEESLKELSKKDRDIIKKILKIQSEAE